MPDQKTDDDIGWREHPITWMSELLIGVERGEYDRAHTATLELERLGWRVKPTTAKVVRKMRKAAAQMTPPTEKGGA